jgi:hypothetical protein
MTEKKTKLGISLVRKHPKTALIAAGTAAAWIIGSGVYGADMPPPAEVPVQKGQQAPNAEPPFDPAAGRYNKEHIKSKVKCTTTVTRGAGSLALTPALDQSVQGIWYSYVLSSHKGTVKGVGTTIADPAGIRNGKLSMLNVEAHYPYGSSMSTTACDIKGPALGAPAQDGPELITLQEDEII